MNPEAQQVQFPHYDHPEGLTQCDPGQQKPLFKMIKNMMKPLKQRDPFHSRRHTTRRGKKLHKFY